MDVMKPPTYSTRSKRKSNEIVAISPPAKKLCLSVSPPSSSSSADANINQTPLEPENHEFDASNRGGFRGRGRGRGKNRGRVNGTNIKTPVTKIEPVATIAGGKASRGRGGHRVKKSSNARIQSLYHRKQLLKTQYKQVALLQRAALDAIAEKSLQSMTEDPKYHETLPEFKVVTDNLAARYSERIALLQAQYEMQKEYLEKQKFLNEQYTKGVYETRVQAIYEKYDLRIKQRIIDEHTQMEMRTGADSPSFHDNDQSHIKRIPAEELFEHPADAWLNGGREAQIFTAEDKAQNKKRSGRARKPAVKPASPSKPENPDEGEVAPKKTSLYQPATLLSVPANLDGESVAPTPAELSAEDDADDMETDKFGVHVPNKARPRNGDPPNNRIVVEPPFKFDEDEIGIRIHHYKKHNKNDLPTFVGMDPLPNPKNFHYDSWVRNHHSTNNSTEDLDQEIVETYKLHPTLGLPVKGSGNPIFKERTDWSKPMVETKPIIFVVDTEDPDQLKPRIETSRSAWMEHTERAYEDLGDQLKMAQSLEAIGARDPILRPVEVESPQSEVLSFERQNISGELLQAVAEASSALSQPIQTPVTTAAIPAAPTSAPRSHGYDPVRDTQSYDPVRDTGYSPHLRRSSPVKVSRDLGNLGVLADAAQSFGAEPPRAAIQSTNQPTMQQRTSLPSLASFAPHSGQHMHHPSYQQPVWQPQQTYGSPHSFSALPMVQASPQHTKFLPYPGPSTPRQARQSLPPQPPRQSLPPQPPRPADSPSHWKAPNKFKTLRPAPQPTSNPALPTNRGRRPPPPTPQTQFPATAHALQNLTGPTWNPFVAGTSSKRT